MKGFALSPVGVVRSSMKNPVSPDMFKDHESRIVLDSFYLPAFEDLKDPQDILVIFRFHRSSSFPFVVHPRGDASRPLRVVFSTCSPRRPNFLGATRCRLVRREGAVLVVKGLDAIDGTPVLDIKPFVMESSK